MNMELGGVSESARKIDVLIENMPQCHFVKNKSHMT
jgi:hypothetical protein